MRTPILTVLLLLAATASAQQLYKWVDDKGRTQYTDTPPPASAKKVEEKKLGRGNEVTGGGETPFAVRQATQSFPVTLWVTNCGDSCTNARAHLRKRGVPYSERNPSSDPSSNEAFVKASGGGKEVPLLVVGQLKTITGFSPDSWDSALDQAGYPRNAAPLKPEPAAKPGAQPPAAAGGTPAPAPGK
ncbi:MAG: DUF4124 domain-containing protein [Burkholderiales bacterium]